MNEGSGGDQAVLAITAEITGTSTDRGDYIPISWPDYYMLNVSDLAVLAGGVSLAIAMVGALARR